MIKLQGFALTFFGSILTIANIHLKLPIKLKLDSTHKKWIEFP